MRMHKDVISGSVILLLCAVGAAGTSQLPPPLAGEWAGPSTMPWITLAATAFCGLLLVLGGLLRRPRQDAGFNIDVKVLAFFAFWVCYMGAMVWLGGLISNLSWISIPHNGGFVLATLLFLLVALVVLGRRRCLEILGVAVGTTGILALAFGVFFQVLLP